MKFKTSISIEKGLWTAWLRFVIARTGSTHKVSAEIERALKAYMESQESAEHPRQTST